VALDVGNGNHQADQPIGRRWHPVSLLATEIHYACARRGERFYINATQSWTLVPYASAAQSGIVSV